MAFKYTGSHSCTGWPLRRIKHTSYTQLISCIYPDPLQLGLEAVAWSGIRSCDKVYVGWTARNQSRALQRSQINHLKRDGAEKDKQIPPPLLFFFLSSHNISDCSVGNRTRSKREKRQRNTDTDRHKEELHQHQLHVRILLGEFIVKT